MIGNLDAGQESDIIDKLSSVYYRISKYDETKTYTHEDMLKIFFFIMSKTEQDYEKACNECGFKTLEANI